MNLTKLFDHLSMFENLITLPADQLVVALHPYTELCVAIGRYFIVFLFMIHFLKHIALMPFEEVKKRMEIELLELLIIMAVFGNTYVYNAVIEICVSLFNVLSDNVFQRQLVEFKGSFRTLIDRIAEQSKSGIDFFNIKAMSSSVITLLMSIAVIVLLITYYVFVSVGMFELLMLLAIGPMIAGFHYVLRTPLKRWFKAILACLLFPVMTGIAVTIINESSVVTHIEHHLMIGSFLTMLLQMILMICFFDLVIIVHAQIFGTRFMNVPVIIKSAFLMMFGNVVPGILNGGFLLSFRKKG